MKTLKIKETDRIAALQNELRKFGAILTEPAEGELVWDGIIAANEIQKVPLISTYHDHRMALATPLALTGNPIEDDPGGYEIYPLFWEDLGKAGFEITAL